VHLLALGFGTGCSPIMPGTIGTLVGVLIYYFTRNLPLWIYLVMIILMFLLGIWLCGKTARDAKVHDHSAIVWDEIVGYLMTMTAAPAGWYWMAAGFVLFRLFDIVKPWPVSWADKTLKGGLGIMMDDAIAAIFSLLFLQIMVYML